MRSRRPRDRSFEVLERRPWLVEVPPLDLALVAAIDQLEELARLLDRGLLSRAEFDRQKRKVLAH